ncbi:MAG TPA: hypothetical protein VF166_09525 [Gemmatimonadaceae bacterium]
MRTHSIVFGVAVAAAACASISHQPRTAPAPERDWAPTIAAAQKAVAGGRYADAEQELTVFAQRHPGSPESRETLYWRALFFLDPANHNQNTGSAVKALDAYLLDGSSAPHREEAQVLRRIALSLDSLSRSGLLIVNSPADTVVKPLPTMLARMLELQKDNQHLKDQLDKTNAELERIKKRLAAPKPDGQ